MSRDVDLYDTHYAHLAANAQTDVRRETYDEDLGQSSWITLAAYAAGSLPSPSGA